MIWSIIIFILSMLAGASMVYIMMPWRMTTDMQWPIYKKIIGRKDNEAYLIRYSFAPFRFILGEENWFSKRLAIKIHKILLSDSACQHDHPWSFISFILKGGYYEWRPCIMDGQRITTRLTFIEWVGYSKLKPKGIRLNPAGYWEYAVWHRPFKAIFRKPEDLHRLELPHGRTCWSFVITFKKRRGWGFLTKNGWVFWRKYSHNQHC